MALGLLATSVFVATDALVQAQAVDSAAVQKFKRMTEFLDGLPPAADLLYRGAVPLMMQDVSLAAVIGQTVIGGVKCDHLLFSR